MRTTVLEGIKDQLCRWDDNHGKVKASYFWSPPSSAGARRSAEKYYTWGDTVKIGVCVIHYYCNYSCSCRYIYWSDRLKARIGDEYVSVNFGDIRYIIECIMEIIEKRAAKVA